jgi:hypothetical protein
VYKSAKDSRNHILWQPSEKSLQNVELDEAGKLAAFRERYGRGFDLDAATEEEGEAVAKPASDSGLDSLSDLISGYAAKAGDTQAALKDSKQPVKKRK